MTRLTHRLISALPWLLAALPFIVISVTGFPGGDDWRLELARIAAYSQAWADRQWPPFWAPYLYAGYGSPIFLFYGHVAVAIASAFHLLVRSYAVAFLLTLLAASAIGVRSMQLAASAAFAVSESSPASARVACYAFLLNPYLLCDLLLRNAAAEYIALCVVPLALFGLWQKDASWRRGACFLALGSALVIATHLLSALWTAALLVVLAISCRRLHVRKLVVAGGLAIATSAYAWLPVLLFRTSIQTTDLLGGKFSFRDQFQTLRSMFDGSSQLSCGPLPLMAALGAVISVLSRAHARHADARTSDPLPALLGLFVALVIVQTPLSLPLWQHAPGMAYFQFPWRFMGPLAIVSALLAAGAFASLTRAFGERKRLQLELLVCSMCVLCSLPQLLRIHSETWPDVASFETMLQPERMQNLRFSATARDEYLPPGAHESSLRGPASVRPILAASDGTRLAIREDRPRAMAIDVRAETNAELCLARWAFPFWQIQVDAQAQPVASCGAGFLRVRVPSGRHRVVVSLPVPDARLWGLACSALGAMGIILLWFRRPSA